MAMQLSSFCLDANVRFQRDSNWDENLAPKVMPNSTSLTEFDGLLLGHFKETKYWPN